MKLAEELHRLAELSRKKIEDIVKKEKPQKSDSSDSLYNACINRAKKVAKEGANSCTITIYFCLHYKDQKEIAIAEKVVARLKEDGFFAELEHKDKVVETSEQGYGHFKMPSCSLSMKIEW